VLGVNVEGELDKARKIADRLDVSFPLLFDDGQQVSEDYALKSMPYTVLVDRDGQIRFIHHGYKPGDENKYIDRLKTLLRR
jgi:peroxiredoxin